MCEDDDDASYGKCSSSKENFLTQRVQAELIDTFSGGDQELLGARVVSAGVTGSSQPAQVGKRLEEGRAANRTVHSVLADKRVTTEGKDFGGIDLKNRSYLTTNPPGGAGGVVSFVDTAEPPHPMRVLPAANWS